MRRSCLCIVLWLAGCGDTVELQSRTLLEITAPLNGSSVFSQAPLTFTAVATNPGGLVSVKLQAGSVLQQTCAASSAPPDGNGQITCTATVSIPDIAAQVQNGTLKLTATSLDTKKLTRTAAVDVTVVPILVSYTQPMASGSPPVANVSGTSTLAIDVQSELPIVSVKVTDNGLPLTEFTSAPYSQPIDWPVELQVGQTPILTVATDTMNRTGSATLTVNVECAQNADCPVSQTCCVSTGVCGAMGCE